MTPDIANMQLILILVIIQSLHAFPTNYRTTTSIVNDLFNFDYQRPNSVDPGSPFQNPLETPDFLTSPDFINSYSSRRTYYPPTVVTPYQRPIFVASVSNNDDDSGEE